MGVSLHQTSGRIRSAERTVLNSRQTSTVSWQGNSIAACQISPSRLLGRPSGLWASGALASSQITHISIHVMYFMDTPCTRSCRKCISYKHPYNCINLVFCAAIHTSKVIHTYQTITNYDIKYGYFTNANLCTEDEPSKTPGRLF